MTEKSGVGSSETSSLVFASTGSNYNFAWNAAADLPNTQAPTQPVAAIAASDPGGPLSQGLMVLSLQDGAYAHLFAYRPQGLPDFYRVNESADPQRAVLDQLLYAASNGS